MGPRVEPDVPLIERAAAAAALGELLERAAAGEGGLGMVRGPGGIGKTELLRALRADARRAGLRVLWATGTELEREFPFGIALQLLERSVEREHLSGAAELAAPLLQGVLPRQPPPTAVSSLFPLLHGLYWVVSNLAERGPLVLVVDDAHWADHPSLVFLEYLARRLEGVPVAIVAAVRSGDQPGAAERVAQLPATVEIDLVPLSATAVARLVRDERPGADEAFCRACADVTGGNPFFVRELLATIGERGLAPNAGSCPQLAELSPQSIRRAVVSRLDRMPAGCAEVARAVAVLGPHATTDALAAVAAMEPEAIARAAQLLTDGGLLVDEDPLAFAHPVLRAGVYGAIPPAARRRMHSLAADALARRGEGSEHVARQLLSGEHRGDAWAAEQLRTAAASSLAAGDPPTAAAYLTRALAEPPPAATLVELLVELGHAEALAGAPGAADRLREAARLSPRGRGRAYALLRLGRLQLLRGRVPDAVAAFDDGLEELGDRDAELAAELQAAWVSAARLDPALRPQAAERVRPYVAAGGGSHGERVLLAHAAESLVFGAERRDEALALARRAYGDGALLEDETADGITWVSALAAMGWCDDLDGYESGVEAALHDAQRRGSRSGFAVASYMRSASEYVRGRLSDAVADLELALEAGREGWFVYVPVARALLARCLLERGEADAAGAALAPVEADPFWSGTTMHAYVLEARARLRLVEGRAADALEDARAAIAIGDAAQIVNPALVPARSRAALAAALIGDAPLARSLAGDELALARRFGAPRPLGIALRAAALVEGGARGLELLAEACSVLEDSAGQLEHARALADFGAALRRSGQRRAARAPLRQALDLAHRFGAAQIERQAHEELLASGARPRRTALRGVDALTPSERRIAELAAAGSTNREIAQALFVTLRTVEAHLSRAYDKLGIRRRQELAAVLRAVA
jgi:DNA-binding CsgD family transcriptional regulator